MRSPGAGAGVSSHSTRHGPVRYWSDNAVSLVCLFDSVVTTGAHSRHVLVVSATLNSSVRHYLPTAFGKGRRRDLDKYLTRQMIERCHVSPIECTSLKGARQPAWGRVFGSYPGRSRYVQPAAVSSARTPAEARLITPPNNVRCPRQGRGQSSSAASAPGLVGCGRRAPIGAA